MLNKNTMFTEIYTAKESTITTHTSLYYLRSKSMYCMCYGNLKMETNKVKSWMCPFILRPQYSSLPSLTRCW